MFFVRDIQSNVNSCDIMYCLILCSLIWRIIIIIATIVEWANFPLSCKPMYPVLIVKFKIFFQFISVGTSLFGVVISGGRISPFLLSIAMRWVVTIGCKIFRQYFLVLKLKNGIHEDVNYRIIRCCPCSKCAERQAKCRLLIMICDSTYD